MGLTVRFISNLQFELFLYKDKSLRKDEGPPGRAQQCRTCLYLSAISFVKVLASTTSTTVEVG